MSMEKNVTLRDYWKVIKKRKWTCIFSFILITAFIVFYTFSQKNIYRATATIEVESQASPFSLSEATLWDIALINTQMSIIKSTPILLETLKKLNMIDENWTIERKEKAINSLRNSIVTENAMNTSLIKIHCDSLSPQKATEIVNTLTELYLERGTKEKNIKTHNLRLFIENQLTVVSSKLDETEKQLKGMEVEGKTTEKTKILLGQLATTELKYSAMLTKLGEQHPEVVALAEEMKSLKMHLDKLQPEDIKYLKILREKNVNEDLYNMLNKRLKEALISEADKRVPAKIISMAMEPTSPIRPNRKIILTLGILSAIIITVVIVFLVENLDTTLDTREEVEAFLGLPVLGIIPHLKLKKSRLHTKKIEHKVYGFYSIASHHEDSFFVEAFRSLSTNLSFVNSHKQGEIILFTSALRREGKSTISSNYGVISVENGRETVIIDADLRKPSIHDIFKLPISPGISDVLIGEKTLEEVVHKVPIPNEKYENTKNLWVITSGYMSPNPIRLFNSAEMDKFVKELQKKYETIIFDTPPLLAVADAVALSSKVKGVILIINAENMNKTSLSNLKSQLKNLEEKILGIVLNNIKVGKEPYYYYYYYKNPKD